MSLDYRADYNVRYVNPFQTQPGGAFPTNVDQLLSVAESAAASYAAYSAVTRSTVLSVVSTTVVKIPLTPTNESLLFTIGERVALIDGLGVEALVTLDGIDTTLGELTFSGDAISDAPFPGGSIRRIFGPSGSERQTMAEYGTPSIDRTPDTVTGLLPAELWGWVAAFTDTLFPEITPLTKFEIEERVIGSGGNLDGVRREFHVMRDTRQLT